jgi:beta-mannosidase
MKRLLFSILLAFFAFRSSASQTVNLDGIWRYRPEARTLLKADGSIVNNTDSLPPAGTMPVPSNWNLKGLPNFNGRVRFEREFDFAQKLGADDRVFLVMHGVDYFAAIEINGIAVGRHEGYFQQFEFDVTGQVRRGKNQVAITVDAPKEDPGPVWPDHKRLIKGIFTHWDCKPGGTDPATGQDGTSAGIWNHVELQVRHEAWLGTAKLQSFLFDRKEMPGHERDFGKDALIFVSAEVATAHPGTYVISAEIGGASASSRVQVRAGGAAAVLSIHLENPRMWWTWDLGEPYLYQAVLTVAD